MYIDVFKLSVVGAKNVIETRALYVLCNFV